MRKRNLKRLGSKGEEMTVSPDKVTDDEVKNLKSFWKIKMLRSRRSTLRVKGECCFEQSQRGSQQHQSRI